MQPLHVLAVPPPMSLVDYKFASGDKCPAKTGRITSQGACKRAAIALGIDSYWFDSSSSPSGCFATEVTPKNDGDSIVAFNSNMAGSKGPGQKLLCAAGAPFQPTGLGVTWRRPSQHRGLSPRPCRSAPTV